LTRPQSTLGQPPSKLGQPPVNARSTARRAARLAAWQAGCAAVARRRDDAYLAKTRAEAAFSGARTQQEAERAERAVKEAAAELKVGFLGGRRRDAVARLLRGNAWEQHLAL
jgi:hypothetical protein